jgi:uncharacterized protein YlxW (UPF0749 family)
MPDTTPPATGHAAETGLHRLRSALAGRPSRSQLLAAVLLALLGYAATVQIQLTHASNDFAGQRRQDLIELLDSLSAASDRAEQQLSSLQNTRDELQSSSTGRAAALAEAKQRLQDLQILAGTVAAQGPGVTITIEDPDASVSAASLLNGIEELRDAGAEAMQINDVRVVASSWVGGAPGSLTVDGTPLQAPYTIKAIGSAHTLSDAVGFPGGLADQIASLGGKVVVQEDDSVQIDALHRAEQPQYAHPTGP